MTVQPLMPPAGSSWTVDDLEALPDDGFKYELFDGSLVVTPPPHADHSVVAWKLRRLLEAQAPVDIAVLQDSGVAARRRNSAYAPDLVIVPTARLDAALPDYLGPADTLAVIEVLSPGGRGRDLILKRHDYAAAGIPLYWIVDPQARTLTVLTLAEAETYTESAVVLAGQRWSTDLPFPLVLDPAEFC
jgi:Uma2 family endonuclease